MGVDPVGTEPLEADPALVAVFAGPAPVDGGMPQTSQYPSTIAPEQPGRVHCDEADGADDAEAEGTGEGGGAAGGLPHTSQ